jgi:hypothetical protein
LPIDEKVLIACELAGRIAPNPPHLATRSQKPEKLESPRHKAWGFFIDAAGSAILLQKSEPAPGLAPILFRRDRDAL